MANPTAAPMLSGAPYAPGIDALLIAETASADIQDALVGIGIRLRSRVDFASSGALLAAPEVPLVLFDARGATEPTLAPLLEAIAERDAEAGPQLVGLFAAGQLDLAAPLLGLRGVQLLCDPAASELVAALVLACASGEGRRSVRIREADRNSEVARLRRLNEEIARIADALTRLTRADLGEEDDFEDRGALRAPEMSYRGPDEPPPDIDAAEIRAVIRARRLRGQFFLGELFADPAWDMLLDLFAANLEKRRVSVSSLCIAAAVPPTTALRWIGTMHDAGLFSREADPGDRRRAYIVLSEKALHGMRAYVSAIRRMGLGLV